MPINEIINEIRNYNEEDLLKLKKSIDDILEEKRKEEFRKAMRIAMKLNAEAMKELTDK